MTKAEITTLLYNEFSLSIKDADEIYDSIFNLIIKSLKKNRSVLIPRFGEFKLKKDKSSKAEKKFTIRFYPTKKFARKINHNFDNLEIVTEENFEPNTDLINTEEVRAETETKISEKQKPSDEFSFELSEEFKKKCFEDDPKEKFFESSSYKKDLPDLPKPIVSDKLKNLHEQIVNPKEENYEEKKTDFKSNLWN